MFQARLAELDHFEAMAKDVHAKAIQRAEGDRAEMAKANERLENNLERFESNRKECREDMKGTTF